MSLKINDQAPDFSLPSTSGKIFHLDKDAVNKPLILYFYPKDFTRVCTKETCSFRDHFEVFRNANIDVYGISTDSIKTHLLFKKQYDLPFELLSDESGRVSKMYKAKLPFLSMSKRITYLLDSQHLIKAEYSDFLGHHSHIEAMISSLNQ